MKNSKLDYKIIKEFLNEEEDDNIFGDEEAKDEPEEAAEETEDAEATDEEGGEEDAEENGFGTIDSNFVHATVALAMLLTVAVVLTKTN